MWTQPVTLAEDALVHRNSVLGRLQQSRTAAIVLTLLHIGILGIAFLRTHGPPCLGCCGTVYGSLARDGDVLLLIGIDAWLVVPEVESFPSCRHERIEVGVKLEQQCGTLFHHEVYVALHGDGARLPCSFGHYDVTSAFFRHFLNGLVYGLLVLCCRCRCLGSVFRDSHSVVGKLRCFDSLFNLLVRLFPCLGRHVFGHDDCQ